MLLRNGVTHSAVRSVQEMLNALDYRVPEGRRRFVPLTVDGIFGDQTEAAVIGFQEFEGLLADGIVGPSTMQALEEAYTQRMLELHSAGADTFAGMPGVVPGAVEHHVLERVPADAYGEGYDRLSLRDDVAAAYRKVHETVRRAGGILTSSGGIRNLRAKVNASRSATSFHYLGRALDLFLYSGMVNPEADPFVVVREEARRYRVYVRCSADREGVAALPEETIVGHAVSYDDRVTGVSVTGRFLDLTALFEQHGFKPIRARPAFESGGSRLGAEWWHFQYETGLVAEHTTFGSELLRLYSRTTLEGTPPWTNRDRIFGIDWF